MLRSSLTPDKLSAGLVPLHHEGGQPGQGWPGRDVLRGSHRAAAGDRITGLQARSDHILLEVPEQHHHLEVDLVTPRANPVDEESSVVSDPQLRSQSAPVTPIFLAQLLQTVGLPGGEVPQQTLAAVLQVVPQPLRSLVGPGLGRFS